MIIINQSLLNENNEEENDNLSSVKDLLQSNAGTTGLMEIKEAIEDLKTPLKLILSKSQCVSANEVFHPLVACVVLCKFCYLQEWTTLRAAL